MEQLDQEILAHLASEGRISFADLGRRVGLSTSAVHQRVKRLEDREVITGYRAVIDHAKVGLPLTALISIVPFDHSAPDDIPERLAHIDHIVSCWSVAGDENYVLLIRVPRPQELEDLLAQIRADGRCSTNTTVVLSTPWEARADVIRHAAARTSGSSEADVPETAPAD